MKGENTMAFLDLQTLKSKLESLKSSDIKDLDSTLNNKEYRTVFIKAPDGEKFKLEVDNEGNLFTTRI